MPLLDPGSPSGSSTSSKRTAYFTIEPAETKDARRLVDIEFQAFENERANQQLSFRDYTKPAHFKRSVDLYTTALKQINPNAPPTKRPRRAAGPVSRTSFLKITDSETGEIVSFAKTELKAYSLAELHQPLDIGHEGEPCMNRDWFGLNERLRREYMGLRKHCCKFAGADGCDRYIDPGVDIGMLATQPCHQHEGAGSMLLDAVLTEADNLGIEVYLEGTDTARPLYEKFGFVAVKEIRFNPADYGLRDVPRERQTVMVRGALDVGGVRQPVDDWEATVAQAEADVLGAQAALGLAL